MANKEILLVVDVFSNETAIEKEVAVVQVILYIGAIAILIIFSVMLTRRVMADTGPQRIPQ